MIPHLQVVFVERPKAGAVRRLVGRLPQERRTRIVFAYPDAPDGMDFADVAVVRDAFVRIRMRVDAGRLSARTVKLFCSAGGNELEIVVDSDADLEMVRKARKDGCLKYVSLVFRGPKMSTPVNYCGADEALFEPDESGLTDDAVYTALKSFRKVAVRNWPLCLLPMLDQSNVISNTLIAYVDGDGDGALELPFEDPERVFFDKCEKCPLALACDGFGGVPPASMPAGPALRVHPRSIFSGKVHLLPVLLGLRRLGRIVVSPESVEREKAVIESAGLKVAVVAQAEAPLDGDLGRHVSEETPAHIFFSVDDSAFEAERLERDFASAESGDSPMGPEVFSRRLGRLLGYPDCCVDAFVEAGQTATTPDLLRMAHERSLTHHFVTNVLDSRSPFTLVPHIPCRFDCPASISMGKTVVEKMDELFPFLGATAKRMLSRITVLLDGGEALFFDGTVSADVIKYTSVSATFFRSGGNVPVGLVAELDLGDAFRVGEQGFSVHAKGQEIAAYVTDKPPIILDFSVGGVGYVSRPGRPPS